MKRQARMLILMGALAVIAAGCAPAEEDGAAPPPGEVQRGGTLLLGLESDVDAAFDPQKEYYSVTWGFYHCCLARTLVTTPTVPGSEGGNELVPDLATDLPEESDDGLTYTFTLKDGIMFGPPLEREIVAQDFITAMEREADPEVGAGYPFYYSVIEGFDAFAEGEADAISGMRAIDEKTLEINLSRPAGDFPFRMSMPASAPVPAEAIEGHEKDYGRYLVSSGPYMFEGSEDLDFADAPVTGYQPGRSIVLVRNPSWDQETDDVRPAYVERIEAEIGITAVDQQNKIDAGELDMSYDYVPPPQAVQRYQTDPQLQARLHVNPADGVNYISLNIAEPPFDDIQVRKAVNFAVDKAGLVTIAGGVELWGAPYGHIMLDGHLNNLLADYDPYPSPNSAGDIEAAKEQMAQSKYDTNGDGVCDDPVCDGVVTSVDEADPYPDMAALLQQNLQPLGITLDINQFERTTMHDKCNDPGAHVAFCPSVGWYKDYADATTFGEPLFGSAAIGPDSCCNYSLIGASPDLLREAGYDVTEVPSIDDQIAECDSLPLGDERFQCWADVDRTLMEDIVPWIPYSDANEAFIVSGRVTQYEWDQFSSGPALDKIALAGGGAS